MPRPAVDVIVPFRGSEEALRELVGRLGRLETRPGDTVIVADNTPGCEPPASGDSVRVVAARGLATPGFARNAGAREGSAEWLVFLDADTTPGPDLIERYFAPPPREETAVLAGAVRDEDPGPSAPAAARYMHRRGLMGQENSLRHGAWGFPQTSNCAFRRAAFAEAGGFREELRAAEDADLWYRLRAAGWGMERRENAAVSHTPRSSLRDLLVQKAQHGAGAAWLDRHYPGSFPAKRRPGLVWWATGNAVRGLAGATRRGLRDEAWGALLDSLTTLAWEFGRSLPNERPLRGLRDEPAAPPAVAPARPLASGASTPAPVAVIVPVHGESPFLAQALDSALAQAPPPSEVVVVDDGSPRPLELAGVQRERCRVVRRERRGGPAAARETGLSATEAPLVALLDHDDVWPEGKLARQLEVMERHPDVAVCFGRAVVIGPDGAPTGDRLGEAPAGLLEPGTMGRVLAERNPIPTSSSLIRRASLEAAGGFEDPVADDWGSWARLAARGERFYFAPDVVVGYRRHAGGLTQDPSVAARQALAVHERHPDFVDGETGRLLRRDHLALLARGEIRRRRWPQARAALREAGRHAPLHPRERALGLAIEVPGLRAALGRRSPFRVT